MIALIYPVGEIVGVRRVRTSLYVWEEVFLIIAEFSRNRTTLGFWHEFGVVLTWLDSSRERGDYHMALFARLLETSSC